MAWGAWDPAVYELVFPAGLAQHLPGIYREGWAGLGGLALVMCEAAQPLNGQAPDGSTEHSQSQAGLSRRV